MWAGKTFQDQKNRQLTINYWDWFLCQSTKAKPDPNGDIFYDKEVIFLPFYDTIFITTIIHNSLIREHNIVTQASLLDSDANTHYSHPAQVC